MAIEYDGEQHFMPVKFGGISEREAKKKLKYVTKMDKLKNRKVKQHPEDIKYFIRFNYKEDLNYKYVYKKLMTLGINKK